MKSFRLSHGRRDGARLFNRVLVGIAVFITGIYLMLSGYLFFVTPNFVSALAVGIASLALVKFMVPKLLLPVLTKSAHRKVLDRGTASLNQANIIFVTLALIAKGFSLFETFLPNLAYTTTGDIVFAKVLPLVLLSSFLHVLYLILASRFNGSKQ